MTNSMRKAWDEVFSPLLRRPKRLQVAALCYTQVGRKKKVLLITSRHTGRWIVPKGWPIDGMNAPEAALQEAWEEAGVRDGHIDETPLGQFEYEKRLDSGASAQVETLVYAVELDNALDLEDSFPEAGERDRKWVSPDEAIEMVQEDGLKAILRQI